MATGTIILWWLDAAVREATLFAAIGFLIGGIDDLLVDLVWIVRRLRCGDETRPIADLTHPAAPGRIAIFVPAWDEAAVIGGMLRTALARIDHPNYRLYVGCYPNDRATIDAVAAIGEHDARVQLVIGQRDGPTTKADCLNVLWQALCRADQVERQRSKAVVIHDAEDVVHREELRVYDALIGMHAIVQIPVLPLVDPSGRWVSATYCDEFADPNPMLPQRWNIARTSGRISTRIACRVLMRPLPDPRRLLRQLAVEQRVSLSGLSRMIGRPDRYLDSYCRDSFSDDLSVRDRDKLSRFFGVPIVELGGDDPRWARWRDHAERASDRKLGR